MNKITLPILFLFCISNIVAQSLNKPFVKVFKGSYNNNDFHIILSNYMGEEFSEYQQSLTVFNDYWEKPKTCYFDTSENLMKSKCYVDLNTENSIESSNLFNYENNRLTYVEPLESNSARLTLFQEDEDWNHFIAIDSTSKVTYSFKRDGKPDTTFDNKYSMQTGWGKDFFVMRNVKSPFNIALFNSSSTSYKTEKKLKAPTNDENYNMYDIIIKQPYYFNDKVVVFQDYNDSYMGGVHGMVYAGYTSYSLQTGKKLLLEDFIEPKDPQLLQAIKNNISETEIEYHSLYVSENYYFTNKGIVFSYNPYQISGFAQGIIEIFVPYHSLKHIKQLNLVTNYNNTYEEKPIEEHDNIVLEEQNPVPVYDKYEEIIKSFFKAEDEHNLEAITSILSRYMTQYYDKKLPTEEYLIKSYLAAWDASPNSQNKIINIVKLGTKKYMVVTEFTFFSKKNKDYITKTSNIVIEFNNIDKIISIKPFSD